MGRLVAIDYGEKRCGIAETDDLKMIASPLTTIPPAEILSFLSQYHQKHKIEAFVLGEARYLNGEASATTQQQLAFQEKLQKHFPLIPIHRINEMFTSKMASQAILMGGASKKQRADKGLVDAVSAALLLQSYLG
jgi:putative Holliday junction resolvase